MKNLPKKVIYKGGYFVEDYLIGTIFDTSEPFPNNLKYCEDKTWEKVLSGYLLRKCFMEIKEDYSLIDNYKIY